MTAFTLRQNLLHMQHHFLCNISYVVIAMSMGKSLKYTTSFSYYSLLWWGSYYIFVVLIHDVFTSNSFTNSNITYGRVIATLRESSFT